jgi:cytochrome c2
MSTSTKCFAGTNKCHETHYGIQTSFGPSIKSVTYRMRRSATHGNVAFDSEQLGALLSSLTINLSGRCLKECVHLYEHT